MNAMIVRLIPGGEHEITGCKFLANIRLKISSIPGHTYWSVVNVGRTRMVVPGMRSKKGDEGIRPGIRGRNQWPLVMIEVYFSERRNLLRMAIKSSISTERSCSISDATAHNPLRLCIRSPTPEQY